MAEMAKEFATTGGVIGVKGQRVVFHALKFGDKQAGEMVFEDGVLYVDCSIIHVAMPPSQQAEAYKRMEAFVLQSLAG